MSWFLTVVSCWIKEDEFDTHLLCPSGIYEFSGTGIMKKQHLALSELCRYIFHIRYFGFYSVSFSPE